MYNISATLLVDVGSIPAISTINFPVSLDFVNLKGNNLSVVREIPANLFRQHNLGECTMKKSMRDMFQDGINIRKSIVKAGDAKKEKRKARKEINDMVSEYYAKKNGSWFGEF